MSAYAQSLLPFFNALTQIGTKTQYYLQLNLKCTCQHLFSTRFACTALQTHILYLFFTLNAYMSHLNAQIYATHYNNNKNASQKHFYNEYFALWTSVRILLPTPYYLLFDYVVVVFDILCLFFYVHIFVVFERIQWCLRDNFRLLMTFIQSNALLHSSWLHSASFHAILFYWTACPVLQLLERTHTCAAATNQQRQKHFCNYNNSNKKYDYNIEHA